VLFSELKIPDNSHHCPGGKGDTQKNRWMSLHFTII